MANERLQGLLSGNDPLFNIGMGILANNQGNYGAFGPALGRGFAQGVQQTQQAQQAAQQQQQAAQQQQMYELQMEQMRKSLEQKQQQEQARQSLLGALKGQPTMQGPYANPEQAVRNVQNPQAINEAMMQYDPDAYIKRLTTPDEAYTLTPGQVRFKGGQQIAAVPGAVEAPKTRTVRIGTQEVTQEFNPKTMKWDEIGRGAASLAQAAQPYYQPVQTAQGVMAFNARTGRLEPINAGGLPVVGAQYDPKLQGQLAGAKESGKTLGEAQAKAQTGLPGYIAQAEQSVNLVDDLLKAPGFKQAVGGSRLLGIQNIPGTNAKDFDIRLDQLKGQQFLQAFESLKGGGQITEVEGRKATDAISRMNASASETEFIKAAREFQDVIKKGVSRAKIKAGAGAQPSSEQPNAARTRADILKQYGVR